MQQAKSILITGASSGLGAALAKSYANEGIKLYISGKNIERLSLIAIECEKKGAEVNKMIIDVTDKIAMHKWFKDILLKDDLDLVIANAGISGGTSGNSEAEEQCRKIFATNLDGVLNTILPILPHFEQKKEGQIVIISSLSGFRGMPSCPAYSASKGAIRLYGEGIRGLLSKNNIKVTVVNPGYIKTPMTDVNKFPMPFLISAEKAADLIKSKLCSNPARISFPFAMAFIVWLMSSISPAITDPIYSRLPGKAPL